MGRQLAGITVKSEINLTVILAQALAAVSSATAGPDRPAGTRKLPDGLSESDWAGIRKANTLCRKVLPDLKAVENTGDLQPAIMRIVREIVDRGSEATTAQADRQARNGADEGAGKAK